MNPARRALSLHARQLIAASLGLVAFLGLTGIALDKAFQSSLVNNMEARMERYALAIWDEVNFDRNGRLQTANIDNLPDARFNNFRSGLYAQLDSAGGGWQSESVKLFSLPKPPELRIGTSEFTGPIILPIGEDASI